MSKHHPRSVPAVAERWGVCQATVYNEIKRGHLEATKIGARTIISEEQERAYLDTRRFTGGRAKRKTVGAKS